MARPPLTAPAVTVREATVDDAPDLVDLWQEVVAEAGPAGRTSAAPTVDAVRARIAEVDVDPTRRLLLGLDGDRVVGLAHVVTERLTPLHEAAAARVSYLHVSEGHRRRGVGTALLTAVSAWAEAHSVEHVVADCNPAARETQRFLARLGFGQLLVQRSVSLPALRRRLGLSAVATEEVLVRRASLRARARGTVAVVARSRRAVPPRQSLAGPG
jgi:GNAT superfamily N-acetyltransferase